MRSLLTSRRLIVIALFLALAAPAVARESTTRTSAPAIEFLDRAAASKAIVDESMEPYFKLLQPMEMSVKTAEPIGDGTLEEQRDRCRKRYQQAVQDFTDEERETLRWYVTNLQPLVADDYPLYARTPWSFIKLDSKFEGGMPHTRGGHVVLSDEFLASVIKLRKQPAEWLALVQAGGTLLHEQSHVVQRENPAPFARLFTGLWNLKHAAAIQPGDWITRHQIVNPDGVDVNWVFPIKEGSNVRWIWPLIVFGAGDDPAKVTFADMQMVAIELEPAGENSFEAKIGPDGKPVMQDLLAVPDYVSVFKPSRNIYHPNEAAADLFAKVVILSRILPGNLTAKDEAALKEPMREIAPLKEWFEKILVAPR